MMMKFNRNYISLRTLHALGASSAVSANFYSVSRSFGAMVANTASMNESNVNITLRDHEPAFESPRMKTIQVLRTCFQCNTLHAEELLRKRPHLIKVNPRQLEHIVTQFRTVFKIKDIMNNPKILITRKVAMNLKRYEALKELGIKNISPEDVLTFDLFSKNVLELKSREIIPKNVNPLTNMLYALHWPEGLESGLLDNIRSNYENVEISNLRTSVIVAYMVNKLNYTPEEIHKKLNRVTGIKDQPVRNFRIAMAFLLEEVGMPAKQIFNCMYLFKHNADSMQNIIKLPSIGLDSTVEVVKRCPQILRGKAHNIQAVDQLVMEYGATREQMQGNGMIYLLLPETIQKRLQHLSEIEYLQLTKSFDQHMKVVLHYTRAMKRLKELSEIGNNKISLNLLTTNEPRYQLCISRNFSGVSYADSISYMCYYFDKSRKEVLKQFSFHKNVKFTLTLSNAIEIITELQKLGVSLQQIWNSLPIVFYPPKVVFNIFHQLPTYPELQPFEEWKSHELFLDLVIYYIEKEDHFSGVGVFAALNEETVTQ